MAERLNLSRRFASPITNSCKKCTGSIRTLKDARDLYAAQPKRVRERPEWKALWRSVALAAGKPEGLWMEFAEIAVRRALSSTGSR